MQVIDAVLMSGRPKVVGERGAGLAGLAVAVAGMRGVKLCSQDKMEGMKSFEQKF